MELHTERLWQKAHRLQHALHVRAARHRRRGHADHRDPLEQGSASLALGRRWNEHGASADGRRANDLFVVVIIVASSPDRCQIDNDNGQ